MRDENLVMTTLIKRRISTELFIDRRAELYMPKWEPELSGKIDEGKMLAPRPTRDGKEKL